MEKKVWLHISWQHGAAGRKKSAQRGAGGPQTCLFKPSWWLGDMAVVRYGVVWFSVCFGQLWQGLSEKWQAQKANKHGKQKDVLLQKWFHHVPSVVFSNQASTHGQSVIVNKNNILLVKCIFRLWQKKLPSGNLT